MSPEFWIDGLGPLPLERPASADDVGRLVRAAHQDGAIYPVGGGTALHLGMPPRKKGPAICLTALNEVIDYPARDMTITVQAGIVISRLNEILASENQRLPIDVPRADKATLGGILAVNVSGPRRYGYGTLRDYVLGISVVNDEGQEVKAGGRVVKNVAGYDLPKLYIGSLGTLGITTQATLKLRPRAVEQALALVRCPTDKLGNLLDLVCTSRTRPVCIDFLNREAVRVVFGEQAANDPSSLVVVGYEGHAETVFWQVNQLVQELKGDWTMDVRLGATAAPLWQALVEFGAPAGATVSFKANLLPGAVADFVRSVESIVHAHAGTGIVRGHFFTDVTLADTLMSLGRWRALAAEMGGQVIVERCPHEWKRDVSVWGPPRGDFMLMKAVKDRLDPRGLFNPGRFLGSI